MVKVVLLVSATVTNEPAVPVPVLVPILLVGEVVQELLSEDVQLTTAVPPYATKVGVAKACIAVLILG
jgi:hypothetical protein